MLVLTKYARNGCWTSRTSVVFRNFRKFILATSLLPCELQNRNVSIICLKIEHFYGVKPLRNLVYYGKSYDIDCINMKRQINILEKKRESKTNSVKKMEEKTPKCIQQLYQKRLDGNSNVLRYKFIEVFAHIKTKEWIKDLCVPYGKWPLLIFIY